VDEISAYAYSIEHWQNGFQESISKSRIETPYINGMADPVFGKMCGLFRSSYFTIVALASRTRDNDNRLFNCVSNSVELRHQIHGNVNRMIAVSITVAREFAGLEILDAFPRNLLGGLACASLFF
jgi:hypothetical protein